MNRIIIIAMFFLTLSLSLKAEKVTLENIIEDRIFVPKGIEQMHSVGDGFYTTIGDRGQLILKQYKKRNYSEVLLDSLVVDGKRMRISSYELSDDRTKMIVASDVEMIYRHSFKADYFIVNLKNKKQSPIHIKGKVQEATLSPDATKVAYVRDNDLYFINLKNNKETRITNDGEFRKIINGLPDWVYEEEFAFSRAFEWSQDSKQLAYMKTDESKVPVYTLYMYDNDDSYPKPYSYKYPKAGQTNATVGVWVYDMNTQTNKELDVHKNSEQYIPRIRWTKNAGELLVLRLNRHQNKLEYLMADTYKGILKSVYVQENKRFVDDSSFDAISFIDSDSFVLLSEKSGFSSLYRYNYKTNELKPWLVKPWDITAFYGVDKDGNAYCQAATKFPYNRELLKVAPNGKYTLLSQKEGWNTARFDKDFRFMISIHSTTSQPYVYTVHNLVKDTHYILEDNRVLNEKLKKYDLLTKEFVELPSADAKVKLSAWRILPSGFHAKKKPYPVLITQYNGPNSQQVKNNFAIGWEQYLAQQGYIVYCIDTRGTAARGEDFRKATYMQLGKLESDDMVAAGKYLQSLPYVDENRITIWGWSYGGFMSSLCLMKGVGVFNSAIAIAPVTHWKYYDSVYTERYMRTPKENPEGYNSNSPLGNAGLLKDTDSKYLLVHGTADDNVHIQNAHTLSARLVAMDFPFEQQIYTDKNHSIYGGKTRLHLYKRFLKFLEEVNKK